MVKLNCRFYSDSLHNYLAADCSSGAEGYQYKMLAANKIKGILPCSLRVIDARTYLYYDITSMQSLSERCESGLQEIDVRLLLYEIARAGRSLSEYLLDGDRLLLDAHYIYIDPVSGRYGFLYYPEPVEGMALSGLLVYLSAHLDLHDKSTASAIFRLIPLSSGTNFILREEQLDFLFHLPQQETPDSGEEEESGKTHIYEEEQDIGTDLPEEAGWGTEPSAEGAGEQGSGLLWTLLVMAVVFLLAAILLAVLPRIYVFDPIMLVRTRVLMMIFFGGAIMSAAAGTIISFNRRREKKSAGRPGDEEEEAPLMRKTLVYPADLLSGHEEERTGVNNTFSGDIPAVRKKQM